jgi:hypothetical protein
MAEPFLSETRIVSFIYAPKGWVSSATGGSRRSTRARRRSLARHGRKRRIQYHLEEESSANHRRPVFDAAWARSNIDGGAVLIGDQGHVTA